MKALFINGSPRKNFNTAKLIAESMRGAKEAGAEVECVDLFDYEFTDCKECFACKIKGSKTNGVCAVKDSIRPVLQKMCGADVIVIGSPVYYGFASGQVRNLLNRAMFPLDTYLIDESGSRVKVPHKKAYTGIIFTMNCPEELMQKINYDKMLGFSGAEMGRIYGYNEVQYCCATYQFTDYAKYDVNMFSEEERKKHRDEQFPKDMTASYEMGKRLVQMAKSDSAFGKNPRA